MKRPELTELEAAAVARCRGNRFAVVAIAVKRAAQLEMGAPPMVHVEDAGTSLTVAIAELAAGAQLNVSTSE